MKKLLLFLALCSGTAGAMQSDAIKSDVAGIMPVKQGQMDLVATVAEQLSALTPEQRQQAIAQATENVQKVVDSCGNDKKLLEATLTQRIENLEKTVFGGSANECFKSVSSSSGSSADINWNCILPFAMILTYWVCMTAFVIN